MTKKVYHTSRLHYSFSYFLAIAFFTVPWFSTFNFTTTGISFMIGVMCVCIGETLVRSNDIIIEEHEIVNEVGILSKQIVSIHYSSITDVKMKQSFFQRLLGIGDLHINTAGTNEREITLTSFSNVQEIRDVIFQKVRKINRKSH